MNGKALVKADAPATSFSEVAQFADVFVKSRYFRDATDVSKAIVKILAGRELGLGPFASMRGFYVTSQGRVEIAANLLASLVRQSGRYDYEIKVHDNEKCEIEFVRVLPDGKTKSLGLSTFTMADAKKAQTQNIEKFPRNMLFARAMSNGQKWFCPDLTNGLAVYAEGETIGDETAVSPTAEVVAPDWEIVQATAAVQSPVREAATQNATPPVADHCGPISIAQLGILDQLEYQLKPTPAGWLAVLASYQREEHGLAVPVTDPRQLSAGQADALIARMQKALDAKKGAIA